MNFLQATILLLLFVTSFAGKIKLPGKVTATSSILKQGNVQVLVDGGKVFQTFVKADGSFVLDNLQQGNTYLVEVICPNVQYPQVQLRMGKKIEAKINDHTQRHVRAEPLTLIPTGKQEYFQKREPFDPYSLLKNPMVWMVGFGMLAIFVFPKLSM